MAVNFQSRKGYCGFYEDLPAVKKSMDGFSHDAGYKYLFSSSRIVCQLLHSFVDVPLVRDIRPENLELVDKSFVSDELLKREADVIDRVRKDGQSAYIYILLEIHDVSQWKDGGEMLSEAAEQLTQIWLKQGIEKGELKEKHEVLIRQMDLKFGLEQEEKEMIQGIQIPEILDSALDAVVTSDDKTSILEILD